MAVFQLTGRISFPPPQFADKSGLLAVGGDLSMERVLLAYKMGIFPWYDNSTPILWWSPDPRMVLYPANFHMPKSLKKSLKKKKFTVTMDEDFESVIYNCAYSRLCKGEETWITEEMKESYIRLHDSGYAHSVEVWQDGVLSGGLYGVSIGRVFFGESMFSLVSDASKTGFSYLVRQLENWNFILIDCQVATDNLSRFGAVEIPRDRFLSDIKFGFSKGTTLRNRWHFDKNLEVITNG